MRYTYYMCNHHGPEVCLMTGCPAEVAITKARESAKQPASFDCAWLASGCNVRMVVKVDQGIDGRGDIVRPIAQVAYRRL